MGYIRIQKIDGGWAAALYGGSAETVKAIIGRRGVIELPYPPTMTAWEVANDLRVKNPHLVVRGDV